MKANRNHPQKSGEQRHRLLLSGCLSWRIRVFDHSHRERKIKIQKLSKYDFFELAKQSLPLFVPRERKHSTFCRCHRFSPTEAVSEQEFEFGDNFTEALGAHLKGCQGLELEDHIPHNIFIQWFISSHFTCKPVEILFTVAFHQIKLTGLWES